MKKKYLAIATPFPHVHAWFHHHKDLMKAFSINFEKIFMINVQNLRFFPNLSKKIYSEKDDHDDELKDVEIPKNFIFFDPKNLSDFENFITDKELIIINNFTRHFFALKIYLILKKHNIKQIQISNFGVFGSYGVIYSLKHIFKSLLHFFNQTLFTKINVLLTNLNIIPKLDIRFLSNLETFNNIKNNKLKNFLYRKKMLWAKEIKLVNSRSYDIFLKNNLIINDNYIVHLDASINHLHEVQLRGIWPEEKVKLHYFHLNKFLEKLSKLYKKEVIVTIHPSYNLEEHKKRFPNFQVLKYKTREYIYQSFIVTAFDSSAVTDAILLKKRIIGLESDYMSENEKEHSKSYPKRVGYLHLNTLKDFDFKKDELLSLMNEKIKNYDKFINNYHCFNKNMNGADEIVKTIKERYFKT